jgi:hypothetical protein
MKKKAITVAALLLAGASGAMAQSAFLGFYGQIATGYESNTVKTNSLNIGPPVPSTYGSSSNNANGAPLVAGLGYYFSVAPSFLLGLGADYSFINQTTGNTSIPRIGIPSDTANFKTQVSGRYNIYVMPGYEIAKDKLIYLKAGYSGQQLQVQPQRIDNFSANTSGYIVGLGYKQIIEGGFYGFGEANYISYSSTNVNTTAARGISVTVNQTPSAYQFLVGVGYKY